MKKRNLIKVLSFIIAGAIALVGLLVKNQLSVENYNNHISQTYSRFMEELCVSLNNINTMLEKSMYVSSPEQLSTIATRLYHHCESAKNALSLLPSFSEQNGSINKFLSQTGNYMISLTKSAIESGKIPSDQRINIEKLRSYSNKLTSRIDRLQIDFNDIRWIGEIEKEISQIESELTFAQEIHNVEQELTDYPTLIYDGPYSDHILNSKPQFLDDKTAVSRQRAREIAADALETDISNLVDDGEDEGHIPAFRFLTEDTVISVSKAGGHIVYFRKNPLGGDALFTEEQAVMRAEEYLKKHTSLTFESTYYFCDEGTCTVNFAYKDGATLCYTDLIKVGVCLNTGNIVMVEARGFLMNHKNRTIQTPSYTQEQAKQVISDTLEIKKISQVLIPVNDSEIHCYEFLCNGKSEDKVLVYINTQNLKEEQILIMIDTFGGVLVK